MSDTEPQPITVINAASWAVRPEQLAQLLARSSAGSVIPDPAGQSPDPTTLAAVGDPGFWSGEPGALADVLRALALPDLDGGGPTPSDRSAGAVITSGPDRLTLTVEEAAATLGISRASAYEAVRRGEIPSIRIGRRVLVPRVRHDRLLSAAPGEDEPET